MGHKGAILRTLVKQGDFRMLTRVTWWMTRSACGVSRRPLFHLPASSVPATPLERPHYTIDRVDSWSAIHASFLQEMSGIKNESALLLKELFRGSAVLWIGRMEGRVANVGWTHTGDHVKSWFFPLADHWVVLSHFLTLPAFRGFGLYSCLLSQVVGRLTQDGIDRFFVDCADWNVPSSRGIQKAGFTLLGHGVSRRNGRLVWCPEERDAACGGRDVPGRHP